MDSQEDRVSNPEVTESGGTTTPQFSTPSSVQPASDNVEAIVERVMQRLMPEVEKKVQSVKDRRFDKVEKLEKQLAAFTPDELSEMGLTVPKEAILEKRLRNLEGNIGSTSDSRQLSTVDVVAGARDILQEASIGTDDPEVVALWKSKTYTNDIEGHKELLNDVARIVVRRAKSPSPTSAQAAAQPGRVMPSPTQEGLLNEYTKDMLANRGNRTAILAVKEKYRKMGLDVDRVAFK